MESLNSVGSCWWTPTPVKVGVLLIGAAGLGVYLLRLYRDKPVDSTPLAGRATALVTAVAPATSSQVSARSDISLLELRARFDEFVRDPEGYREWVARANGDVKLSAILIERVASFQADAKERDIPIANNLVELHLQALTPETVLALADDEILWKLLWQSTKLAAQNLHPDAFAGLVDDKADLAGEEKRSATLSKIITDLPDEHLEQILQHICAYSTKELEPVVAAKIRKVRNSQVKEALTGQLTARRKTLAGTPKMTSRRQLKRDSSRYEGTHHELRQYVEGPRLIRTLNERVTQEIANTVLQESVRELLMHDELRRDLFYGVNAEQASQLVALVGANQEHLHFFWTAIFQEFKQCAKSDATVLYEKMPHVIRPLTIAQLCLSTCSVHFWNVIDKFPALFAVNTSWHQLEVIVNGLESPIAFDRLSVIVRLAEHIPHNDGEKQQKIELFERLDATLKEAGEVANKGGGIHREKELIHTHRRNLEQALRVKSLPLIP